MTLRNSSFAVRKSVGPTASAPAVAASSAFNGGTAKRGSIDITASAAEDVPESDKKDPKEADSSIIGWGKVWSSQKPKYSL